MPIKVLSIFQFSYAMVFFVALGWMQVHAKCDLVAHLAGQDYQAAPDFWASMEVLADNQPVAQVGIWQIYRLEHLSDSHCGQQAWQGHNFLPVLRHRDRFAVIHDVWVIKTHRVEDLARIPERYGFQRVSSLPNRFTAVFNIHPTEDYEAFIKRLDRDKAIDRLIPVLVE
jgi:hypothetical protein